MSTNHPLYPQGDPRLDVNTGYEPTGSEFPANSTQQDVAQQYLPEHYGTEQYAAQQYGTEQPAAAEPAVAPAAVGYGAATVAPLVTAPRSVGQLVADAADDFGTIIRGEIQLAKAEVTSGMRVAGIASAFAVVAGGAALFGLIFLLHTLARVIALWLPLWAGYLIVTAVLFLIAAIFGLLAFLRFKKAKPVPKRAIAEAQQTVNALKNTGR